MSPERSASRFQYLIPQDHDNICIEDLNLVDQLYFQNRPPRIIYYNISSDVLGPQALDDNDSIIRLSVVTFF